jgi:Cu(I)/Ag(I) efflux system membrane protein CusA/SilA
VLAAFIPMYLLGIPATIMSLGGIAIAIGATVDAEIVMVEAAHKKLEHAPPDLSDEERSRLLAEAAREVTPAIFFSLLIIARVVPAGVRPHRAGGRLFRPLAYTKTFVMLSAALLSVTVAPALRDYLIRGRSTPRPRTPSRARSGVYEPFVHVALRNPKTTVLIGVMAVLSALPLAPRLGSEFMPPLDEGDLLYMPTTLPNISIEEARGSSSGRTRSCGSFPEVRVGARQGGPRREPHRPGAAVDGRDRREAQAPRAVAHRYVRRWYVGRTPVSLRPLLNGSGPSSCR